MSPKGRGRKNQRLSNVHNTKHPMEKLTVYIQCTAFGLCPLQQYIVLSHFRLFTRPVVSCYISGPINTPIVTFLLRPGCIAYRVGFLFSVYSKPFFVILQKNGIMFYDLLNEKSCQISEILYSICMSYVKTTSRGCI